MEAGFWMRRALDGFTATAEALFPPNERGFPDAAEAETPERFATYLAMLHPSDRRLLVTLYAFVELCPPLLLVGLGRLSRLPAARRLRAIERWRRSRIPVLRMLGDGLKATVTMMYLGHPRALARIGYFKTCANPADPLQPEIRPGRELLSEEGER